MALNILNFAAGKGDTAKNLSNNVAASLPPGLQKPAELTNEEWIGILRQKKSVIAKSNFARQRSKLDLCEPTGFGLLYNAHAYTNPTLAPIGTRVATREDWEQLINHFGADMAGFILKGNRTESLGRPPFWNNNALFSKSVSYFYAYGAGIRNRNGDYDYFTERAYFATTTPIIVDLEPVDYVTISLDYNSREFIIINFPEIPSRKINGLSVRCIVDESNPAHFNWAPGTTITDIDGNIYGTIKLGNQVWLTANLATTKYNNGLDITHIDDPELWINAVEGAFCYPNGDINMVGRTSQF